MIITKSKTLTTLNSHAIDSEDEAMIMMMKADACAHSDTCSIDEAQEYLNEMLHLQSNCVSGSLTSQSICDDITVPMEVIGGLRDKIQQGVELSNQGSAFKVGFNPIFITLLALYASSGMIHNNPDAFTMQEWMYALQGGYLDDLVSQYVKYGGLSPMTADSASVVLPLTAEELWWSIRDGYLGNMISEYQNHGGFLSMVEEGSNAEDAIATTSLTTQEWSYALKDGYLREMIEHYMRHGGL